MKKIFLTLLFSKFLFALSLSPLMETIDSKKDKHLTFSVGNPSSEPIAVDFSLMQVIETEGKEQRVESDKVSCYPSQFVLAPHKTKKVRIRYMGKSLPKIEEVYRVIAKELDIDVSDKVDDTELNTVKASVTMRFSYEGLLFVKKPNAIDQLKIDSFEQLPEGLKLNFLNTGNASAVPNPKEYLFVVSIGNKEYKLQKEDFKDANFRRVLSGKRNTFYLRYIKNLPQGKIESVRIERI